MNALTLLAQADFWSSDQHLSHVRIPELTGRPYSSIEQMNTDLIERWNAVVRPDQIVAVLGDFALGKLHESLPLTRRLHGIKVLVPGNHDRVSTAYRGSAARKAEWEQMYLDAGFVLAPEQATVTLEGFGITVNVCHFPYSGDSGDQDRHADLRPVDDGLPLLHGHVHQRWQTRRSEISGALMINVGVDAPGWDFTPVSTATLAGLLRDAVDNDDDREVQS